MKIEINEGRIVKVGDCVEFKSDIEQSGRITKIQRSMYGTGGVLTIEGNFIGEYIGGRTTTVVDAQDCW
tara:strand:+ start:394 stop:600 length:207 start_codon:yes stop_codon:yes gene_type:complete